jgi:hypothetical protein
LSEFRQKLAFFSGKTAFFGGTPAAMPLHMKTKKTKSEWKELVLSLFLVAVGVGATVVTSDASAGELRGRVEMVGPVANGTIKVYDLQGKLLETHRHAIGESGAFLLPVTPAMQGGVRLVATGVHAGSEPAETLELIQNQVEPGGAIVKINALTTLVSAYQAKHPTLSRDEVTAKAEKYLDLTNAKREGGTDRMIQLLLHQMESDPSS